MNNLSYAQWKESTKRKKKNPAEAGICLLDLVDHVAFCFLLHLSTPQLTHPRICVFADCAARAREDFTTSITPV